MRGGQKSKRVCWATDGNLCQVQLFLSEDPPSQVGSAAQDHLQAKRSSHISQSSYTLQSNGLVSDDSLPPGFEEYSPAIQLKNRLAQIPLAKWICPPRLMLDARWQVVAGDESKEIENQNQREMRVLEAIYPRPSVIPPNAAESLEKAAPDIDDPATPVIPITPIEEEEDATEDIPPGYAPVATASVSSLTSGLSATPHPMGALVNGRVGVGMMVNGQVNSKPELASAASAAVTDFMRSSNNPGSLIDHELLAKILGNPKILEGLVQQQGASSSTQNAPPPLEAPQIASRQLPTVTPIGDWNPVQFVNKMGSSSSPSVAASNNAPFYSCTNVLPHVVPCNPSPPVNGAAQVAPYAHPGSASLAKDPVYYKSLIQQHGGEKHPVALPPASNGSYNQPMARTSKPLDYRQKSMKPCIFFNSPKGCRHGANCAFQHDPSLQQGGSSFPPETQNAKRTKMEDRDIRGPQSYGYN